MKILVSCRKTLMLAVVESFKRVSAFVFVSALWGCTNPFISEGTKPEFPYAGPEAVPSALRPLLSILRLKVLFLCSRIYFYLIIYTGYLSVCA
jgi:hypothetical protein